MKRTRGATMPSAYVEPGSTGPKKQVRFWIKSSRGTDRAETVCVPAEWSEDSIKDELEEWCEQFGAWHSSENLVSYGFEVLP
jgi:hypothetical protein